MPNDPAVPANPPIERNVTIIGDLVLTPLSTPGAPVVTQTGRQGSTAYSYKVVAVSEAGGKTEASPATETTTGAATLDFENFNTVAWQLVTGAAHYDVYRTASGGTPSSTGKIGRVDAKQTTFDDVGLTGDEADEPSENTTGRVNGVAPGGTPDPSAINSAYQSSPSDAEGLRNALNLRRAVVDLTAEQLATLVADSPLELIAAPGAGKIIVPKFLTWIYSFGTTPFGSSQNWYLFLDKVGFDVGSDPKYTQDFDNLGFQALSDQVRFGPMVNDDPTLSQDLSAVTNKPLMLGTMAAAVGGVPLTVSVASGGADYAVGDTLALNASEGAHFTVDTVDGDGAVLTFTMTSPGTIPVDPSVSGWNTTGIAPQAGIGTGFQINIDSVTPGDGSVRAIIDYEVLELA